ncbi:hypothetical protein N072000002_08060 [Clostridium tetani]|uniref:Uncharacterized protein n=1 Tax=Clostridium tetani TaxID=1513 RepID=A0ABC8EAC5_CLOTA|nr:hypothetical protein [Clostridium tetani]BDR75131.1 hypothetical protein K154306013_07910 [Clostridium tetani]BDR80549.1 hypothetical protein K234311028_07950 [Clostridium tetani]BDR89005.1 hypothetical protein N072000002_08060 [Clostridium tetani]
MEEDNPSQKLKENRYKKKRRETRLLLMNYEKIIELRNALEENKDISSRVTLEFYNSTFKKKTKNYLE